MNDDTTSLLSDGTYRARWLRAVIKATHVTDSVRVLLMTLALYMDASGRVSVPRDELAALLGRNERKVGEKVKLALESGLLVRTVRGQKHRVAVYFAAIDGAMLSVPPVGPPEQDGETDFRMSPEGQAEDSQGAGSIHPEPDSQGAGFKHPETQGADFRMSPGGPAEDSQEAPRGPRPSFKGVDVCEEVDLEDPSSLFDVAPAAEPPETAKSRRKPETPIPADFAVTAEMRAWASSKGFTVDLDRQTVRFINHAHQNDRRCRDWVHAWRNWIDIAQERTDKDNSKSSPRGNGSGSQVPPRGARQHPFRSKRESA